MSTVDQPDGAKPLTLLPPFDIVICDYMNEDCTPVYEGGRLHISRSLYRRMRAASFDELREMLDGMKVLNFEESAEAWANIPE